MSSPQNSNDLLHIIIPNWEKFNPRKDRANYSWFRMENSFFEDQSVFCLCADLKLIYLFILCSASKKNSRELFLRVSYMSALLKYNREIILEGVKTIEEVGLIQVKKSTAALRRQRDVISTSVHRQNVSLRNDTYDTDVTNETNDTDDTAEILTFDFEFLYKKYPLKKGKEEGLKRCLKTIHTPELYNQLSKAIDRYSADIIKNQTLPKFIKHFSTFIENRTEKPYTQPWRDWIDDDAGTSVNSSLNGKHPKTAMDHTIDAFAEEINRLESEAAGGSTMGH